MYKLRDRDELTSPKARRHNRIPDGTVSGDGVGARWRAPGGVCATVLLKYGEWGTHTPRCDEARAKASLSPTPAPVRLRREAAGDWPGGERGGR